MLYGSRGFRESPDRQIRFQRDWVARGRWEDVWVVIPGPYDQDAGMIRAESSQCNHANCAEAEVEVWCPGGGNRFLNSRIQ